MQCPAIGSCLIEEFCGTYYQQGVPPCASKLVEAAPSASANKLQAEIAALIPAVEACSEYARNGEAVRSVVAKMRQLSAVQ